MNAEIRHRNDRRRPRWIYDVGSEPDPRFSLANERTFLAWIRTALALTAGGVALEGLSLDLQPTLRGIASATLIVVGAVIPLLAWLSWGRTERALREDRPLPAPALAAPLGVVVLVAAVFVGAAAVVR